jgi:hypothetical protein
MKTKQPQKQNSNRTNQPLKGVIALGAVMRAGSFLAAVLLVLMVWPWWCRAQETDGQRLLDAAKNGQVAAVQSLLGQPVSPQVKDEHGRTPLHLAAAKGHQATAEALLRSGAEINALDHSGKTPLDLAEASGHSALAAMLLNRGGKRTQGPATLVPGPPKHSFAIVTGEAVVITDADIIEYRFAEHALKIRGESLWRMSRMRPPAAGTPFHVVADGERVYEGRFVSVFSSRTFKEPTIVARVDTNQPMATMVTCGPSYGEPQYQPGTDPRVDVRITRALSALGKLAAGVADAASNDEALTRRITDILLECQKIKPGMTRAELSRVFTTEGGLSTAEQRTFVYRGCPYIKVDVGFTLSGTNRLEERPADTVRKISRPYLEWSIHD